MVIFLAACTSSTTLPAGDPTRPDIVLVSIDSLRADHLGSYGYERPTSPFLDRLAADGQRFTRARTATAWTLPSHLTMLTGLWPTQHGVIEDHLALAEDVPLIQERLRAAGWATGAFVSSIYVSRVFGFARGFDLFQDWGITTATNLDHPIRASDVVDAALGWAASAGEDKPIFLFLHTYDVHYPYLPGPGFDDRFDRTGTVQEARYRTYRYYQKHPLPGGRLVHQVAQYDECIASVDAQLNRLAKAWAASGRKVRFVVTADHGEELGERGSWGHAHTLYPEARDIPLIVSGEGIEAAVRDELVGTIDLAPTLAALAGVPWNGTPGLDVRGAIPARSFLAETSRFETARLSLEDDAWRLDIDLAASGVALFDQREDEEERQDVAKAHTEEVERLQRALFGLLGEPWAVDAGTVRTSGYLWRDGRGIGPALATPGPFGLYPSDATVQHDTDPAVRGELDAPATGPLRFTNPRRSRGVALGDATRAQLEALGYLQEEEKE